MVPAHAQQCEITGISRSLSFADKGRGKIVSQIRFGPFRFIGEDEEMRSRDFLADEVDRPSIVVHVAGSMMSCCMGIGKVITAPDVQRHCSAGPNLFCQVKILAFEGGSECEFFFQESPDIEEIFLRLPITVQADIVRQSQHIRVE